MSRAIKSRDEFLATLFHELRTPMNIVLGWIEILKSEGPDSALFTQATETLERNACEALRPQAKQKDISLRCDIATDRVQVSADPTKLSHSGLGLGLAICKHIVEAHAGTISVTSPGRHQGATFAVEIPMGQTTCEI